LGCVGTLASPSFPLFATKPHIIPKSFGKKGTSIKYLYINGNYHQSIDKYRQK